MVKRLEWWLCQQMYNRGVLDEDPAFRSASSRYHRLWQVHTGGWSPLHAVWLVRELAEFEEARRQWDERDRGYRLRVLKMLAGRTVSSRARQVIEDATREPPAYAQQPPSRQAARRL